MMDETFSVFGRVRLHAPSVPARTAALQTLIRHDLAAKTTQHVDVGKGHAFEEPVFAAKTMKKQVLVYGAPGPAKAKP